MSNIITIVPTAISIIGLLPLPRRSFTLLSLIYPLQRLDHRL